MKGADPRPNANPAPRDETLDARQHLVRRFVGESHGENLAGLHGALTDEPGNPVGDHARFAGPGAREHEERPLVMGNRFALLRIETGKIDHVGGITTTRVLHEIPR